MSTLTIPSLPLTVAGRDFTLDQVYGGKFYHGTIHDLAIGGELLPSSATGIKRNFKQSDTHRVSVTSDESSAWEWTVDAAKRAGRGRDSARVYQVHPMGEMLIWNVAQADGGRSFRIMEIRCDKALVLDEVFRRTTF